VQAYQNCYGPRGLGPPPSGPYLAGLDARYIADELRWKDGRRASDPSKAMEVIARSLCQADFEARAAYYGAPAGAQR
jgi:cytochrome c553